MRILLASLVLAQAPFATCGRTPAAGVTYDCPDGRALTVTYADSSTAIVRIDGEARRLTSATKGGPRWTDSTVTLTVAGDTARLERGGAVVREGCVTRNPELAK